MGSRPAGSRNSPEVMVPPGWAGTSVVVGPEAVLFLLDPLLPHAAATMLAARTSVIAPTSRALLRTTRDPPSVPAPPVRRGVAAPTGRHCNTWSRDVAVTRRGHAVATAGHGVGLYPPNARRRRGACPRGDDARDRLDRLRRRDDRARSRGSGRQRGAR